MYTNDFIIHLKCPWCHKSETLGTGKAILKTSHVCSKCKKVYIVDWYTLQTSRASPQRRTECMKNKSQYN